MYSQGEPALRYSDDRDPLDELPSTSYSDGAALEVYLMQSFAMALFCPSTVDMIGLRTSLSRTGLSDILQHLGAKAP
jgi:hypothetical protein